MIKVPLPILNTMPLLQGPHLATSREARHDFISYKSNFQYLPPLPEWIASVVPTEKMPLIFSPGSLRRFEIVEREGDPRVGTVVFLRYIHASDRDKDYHVVVNTGLYQFEVLKELRRQYNAGVRALFEEGTFEDRVLTADERAFTQKIFPYLPSLPTRDQLHFVYKQNVTWIFSGLFPDVHNHRVMNRTEHEKDNLVYRQYSEAIRRFGKAKANLQFAEYMITQRDGRTVRELKNYLDEHPGETVVVAFGSGHRLAEAFELMDFKARLVSVWWDHPELKHRETMPASLQRLLKQRV